MSETQARCRPRTVVGMSARHAEEPDESTPPELDGQGHEVAALLDAARDLASTRELRPLLQVLLDSGGGRQTGGTGAWRDGWHAVGRRKPLSVDRDDRSLSVPQFGLRCVCRGPKGVLHAAKSQAPGTAESSEAKLNNLATIG